MIKFFRHIRKKLLGEGKTGKYFKYAVGEIVLVVIGILLALQINTWNQQRKDQKAFEFGLKQVYIQFLSTYYDLAPTQKKLQLQLAYIDSIENHVELLDRQKLPGIIQMLDYSGFTGRDNLEDSLTPYLQLNPDNETQNELAKAFIRYIQVNQGENNSELPTFSSYNPSVLFYEYLKKSNISLRFINTVEPYHSFINPPTPNYYSETELIELEKLIKAKDFLTDLKTTKYIKQTVANNIPEIIRLYNSTLEFLATNYPSSKYKHNKLEIIGTATEIGNWGIGVPMNYISDGVFELETELQSGWLKFRNDTNWTFDWGEGQSNSQELTFKGANIKVIAGKYRVKVNIHNNTYSLTPLNND